MPSQYAFQPDYAVAPGATLRDVLEDRGMSQACLALRTGLAEKTVSQIVNGVAPITFETSEKLELAVGVPASFWNRRELAYREALARADENTRMKQDVKWLADIPTRALIDRGYIHRQPDKPALVRAALAFFGVSSVDAWRKLWLTPEVQFRGAKAQKNKPGHIAAWLRMGEAQASHLDCEPFVAEEFRHALLTVRNLMIARASVWRKEVPAACSAAGVAVVLTKEIPGAGVSGATHWLRKDKALIQLSLKYKTEDQFWFTFFHEAGHILLHSKKQLFIERGVRTDTGEERDANTFSQDFLIPRKTAHRLPHLKSKAQIREFASSIGVPPGVIVGRLQRDKFLPYSHCNDLKAKFEWGSDR